MTSSLEAEKIPANDKWTLSKFDKYCAYFAKTKNKKKCHVKVATTRRHPVTAFKIVANICNTLNLLLMRSVKLNGQAFKRACPWPCATLMYASRAN